METINSQKLRHLKLAICQIVFANLFSIQSRPTSMNKSICGNRPQNSFLWRVEGQPPSYFYGTIHVPYDMVWPDIPQNAKMAFETSDHVYFELDLNDPATMRQLTNCQMLPPGQTLKSIVPPSLYRRIRAHLAYVRRVLPAWLAMRPDGIKSFSSGEVSNSLSELGAKSREMNDNQAKNMTPNRLETQYRITYYNYIFQAITGGWQFKRPIWVMLMLNSLTERDVRSREIPVLDLYLSTQADLAGKTTGAVENVRDQCAPLNELKMAQVIAALNYTLVKQELKRAKRHDAPILTSNIPTTSTKVQSGNLLDSTSFPNANRVTDDHSIKELIDMYNCGDLEKLFSASKSESTKDSQSSTSFSGPLDKYFRSELIHKRNKNMAERVIDLLYDNLGKRSLFFAFGAGHFLGDDTIIDRVRKAGFIVTHLSAHDIISKHLTSYNLPHLENVDRHDFKRQRLKANFDPIPDVPNNIITASQFFGYEFPMAPLLIQTDVQSLSVASPLAHYSMYNGYGNSPTFKDLWVRDNVPSRTFNKPRLRMMTQSKRNIGALRKHKTERNSVNGGNYLPQSNQIKLPLFSVIVVFLIHVNHVFILII